mgnify:CR=1 FL=1
MSELSYSDVVRILGLIDRAEDVDIELQTGALSLKVKRAGAGAAPISAGPKSLTVFLVHDARGVRSVTTLHAVANWRVCELKKAVQDSTGVPPKVQALWHGRHMLAEDSRTLADYMVADASGGTSVDAHNYAMDRMVQAGVVPVTWQQVLLEWQRDWAHRETYDDVMALVKEHSGAYGMGVDYAYTMVHKAPERVEHGPRIAPKAAS